MTDKKKQDAEKHNYKWPIFFSSSGILVTATTIVLILKGVIGAVLESSTVFTLSISLAVVAGIILPGYAVD